MPADPIIKGILADLAAWIADGAGEMILDDGQDPVAMLETTRQESAAAELRADALVAAFLEQVAFVESADE